jgi:hypothetical protein
MYKPIVENLRTADCCESCLHAKDSNFNEELMVRCVYGVRLTKARNGDSISDGISDGISDDMEKSDICDDYVRVTEGEPEGQESKVLRSFLQKSTMYGEVGVQESNDKLVIMFTMICKGAPDMFLYKKGNFDSYFKGLNFDDWLTELVTKHIPDKVLGWSHM